MAAAEGSLARSKIRVPEILRPPGATALALAVAWASDGPVAVAGMVGAASAIASLVLHLYWMARYLQRGHSREEILFPSSPRA